MANPTEMTKLRKQVIDHLFSGGYLMVRDRRGTSKFRYTLYKGNQSPVRIYLEETVKPILQICKKDSEGRFTLNLNLVRQHRKNAYIKKVYLEQKTNRLTIKEQTI